MAAKIFRINYKSDFTATLESDAGWMTPFCIKFWTGSPQQAYFVGWDGTTYNHCSFDPSEPKQLVVQFDDHHLPIGELKFQVAYHFTIDDFPNDTEDEVINQAGVTTEIDGEEYKVMLDFTGETAPEIQFSLPAYANEAQRIANEQQRIANEQQRILQEQQRIEQEGARVVEFGQIQDQATADHRQAVSDHGIAVDDHTRANSDHGIAVDDHTQAGNDHTRAESDHGIAVDDHTQAGNDHTRAESDHGIAVDDHTQAGNDHTRAGEDHTRAESDHTRAESDHDAVEVFVESLGAFDLSQHNAVGGVLAKYATLQDAINALNALPASYKYGGMSFKYVSSSDNNYLQFRCIANEFTTDTDKWAICSDTTLVECPEFKAVWTDKDGKITVAIENDGNVHFGAGVPKQIIEYVEGKVAELNGDINAIKAFLDGFTGTTLLEYLNDTYGEYIENPEFIDVKTDDDGKIIESTKNNGNKFFGGAVEVNGVLSSNELSSKKIQLNGKELSPVSTVDVNTIIHDPEGRLKIETDEDNKIISHRKHNGILVEGVGIETPIINTNSLNLTEEGMTDFQQALKDSGFELKVNNDFSDAKYLEFPQPARYGLLNLEISALPVSDTAVKGYAEYFDAGYYFKKKCKVEIQGQTSRNFALTEGKGNYTLKIDDKSKIKFGSWVSQKSFHLKGSAKDVTRGILATSYKYAWEFMQFLKANPNRVLMNEDAITTTNATGKRITDWPTDARCLPDGFPVELYINGEYWGIYALQLQKKSENYSMDDTDYTSFLIDAAELMSSSYNDGFWTGDIWWKKFEVRNPEPLIDVFGNEYDGDDPKELIDEYSRILAIGAIPSSSYNGCIISLTVGGINHTINVLETDNIDDIKTKILAEDYSPIICVNTSSNYVKFLNNPLKDENDEYYPQPIVSATVSPVSPGTSKVTLFIGADFDSSNPDNVNTALTKSIIETFPQKYGEVKDLIDEDRLSEAKVAFEANFDYNACMLVYIYNCLMRNVDSVSKNTLWGTYKNGKIAPFLWDLDSMYGERWIGNSAQEPSSNLWDTYKNASWPLGLFGKLYATEIKEAYSQLRSNNIISIENWHKVIFGWVNNIGEDAYKRDIKKWPDTPSYRKNYTNTGYWKEIDYVYNLNNVALWDETTPYNSGTRVALPMVDVNQSGVTKVYMVYEAVQNVPAGDIYCPVTKFYDTFPFVGGFYDSPKRWEKWMDRQILLCDVKQEYNLENIVADFTIYRGSDPSVVIYCRNMSISHPEHINDPATHVFVEGHLTKREKSEGGETIVYYTMDYGAETAQKESPVSYQTVADAIAAFEATSPATDIPSVGVYYIEARTKDVDYQWKTI